MTTTYRLTAAGMRALTSERSVPAWYRAILGLFQGDMTPNEVVGGMSANSSKEVLTWLGQLETLGFVEPVAPADPEPAAEAAVDSGATLGYVRSAITGA